MAPAGTDPLGAARTAGSFATRGDAPAMSPDEDSPSPPPTSTRSESPQRTLKREADKTRRTVRNAIPKGRGDSAPQRHTKNRRKK